MKRSWLAILLAGTLLFGQGFSVSCAGDEIYSAIRDDAEAGDSDSFHEREITTQDTVVTDQFVPEEEDLFTEDALAPDGNDAAETAVAESRKEEALISCDHISTSCDIEAEISWEDLSENSVEVAMEAAPDGTDAEVTEGGTDPGSVQFSTDSAGNKYSGNAAGTKDGSQQEIDSGITDISGQLDGTEADKEPDGEPETDPTTAGEADAAPDEGEPSGTTELPVKENPINISLDKETADTWEKCSVRVTAQKVDQVELYPDYDGDRTWVIKDLEKLEDGSYMSGFSYLNSGTYHIVAVARIGEETILSDPVEIVVAASAEKAISPLLPVDLPTVIGNGKSLSFHAVLPEHAEYMDILVDADTGDEKKELFSRHISKPDYNVSISADALAELPEGTVITVHFTCAGRGYDVGYADARILKMTVAPSVHLAFRVGNGIINSPVRLRVSKDGTEDINAVRIWVDEQNGWYENKVYTARNLDEDGNLEADIIFKKAGEHLVYAQVSFDEWEDGFDGNEAVFDTLKWVNTNPGTINVTSVGEIGEFSCALQSSSVPRGEALQLSFTDAEHADSYSGDILRWDEDADNWKWFDSLPETSEAGTISIPTLLMEPGDYCILGRAKGSGYPEREASNGYVSFQVTESQLQKGQVTLSVNKADVDTLEEVTYTVYAPHARWVEIFPDYDGDSDRKDTDVREAFEHVASYERAGTYKLVAVAHYEEGDEGTASLPQTIHVTALTGKALKLEQPKLPSFLTRGDALTFSVPKAEGARYMSAKIWYEAGEENARTVLFEKKGRAKTLEVELAGDQLAVVPEGSYIQIDIETSAPGYDGDAFHAEIPYLLPDPSVTISFDEEAAGNLLVNQKVDITIASSGKKPIQAVRVFEDEKKSWAYYGQDELAEGDGSLVTDISWWNPGKHILYAQVTYDEQGENPEKREQCVWVTSNVINLHVGAYGVLSSFYVYFDKEKVSRAKTVAVTYTRSRHADDYWLEVERKAGDSWIPFGNMGHVDEPGTVNISTLSMEPGIYRLTGMANGIGYVGRRAENDSFLLEVTQPKVREGEVLLTVSKNELDTREDVTFSVYAPGAKRVDVYPDHDSDPGWSQGGTRGSIEQATSYSKAGTYQMVAVAHYDDFGEGVPSNPQTITVISSTGKALQLELPDLPTYLKKGDSLDFTIKKPKYAEDLSVRIWYDSDEKGEKTELFSSVTHSGFIGVNISGEQLSGVKEGDLVHIRFDATARGYDADIYEAVLPFITPDPSLKFSINGDSALINEPVDISLSSDTERKLRAVRIWWDESCSYYQNHIYTQEELNEAGSLQISPYWESTGSHIVYAQASFDKWDGDENSAEDLTWLSTEPKIINITKRGDVGAFSTSLIHSVIAEGDAVELSYTEAEHAEKYWVQIERWNGTSRSWEMVGCDGETRSYGQTAFMREDLKAGSYRITGNASAVGYMKQSAENEPLRLEILPKEAVEEAMGVLEQIKALPESPGVDDAKLVEDARNSYELLGDIQKRLIDEAALEKLSRAESSLASAKKAAEEAAKKAKAEMIITDARVYAEASAANAVAAANTAKADPTAANIKAAENAISSAKKAISAAKKAGADTSIAAKVVSAAYAATKEAKASYNLKITFGNSSVQKKLNSAGTKTSRILLKKGKKLRLKAKASDGSKVTYKSSRKKVAIVSSKGVVKGIKKGKATITVMAGKKKVKVLIRVT